MSAEDRRKPCDSAAYDEDPDDWDNGFRFFTGMILVLPYGLALWIFLWCVFTTQGCLM